MSVIWPAPPEGSWMEDWEALGNRHYPWWLYVCDKTGQRLEVIKDPQSMSLTLAHAQPTMGTLTLPAHHARIPMLMADGARYEIRSTVSGDVLSTGSIRGESGQGAPSVEQGSQIGNATWVLADDILKLSQINIDPPAGKAHDRQSGPAETVAKGLIGRAMTRLGVPHVITSSLGRGQHVVLSGRYQPLRDVLYPAITDAGIGIRIRWDYANQRYTVDAYEPKTWTKKLTTHSGIVDDWSWSRTAPGATRVTVLGPREGVLRLRRVVTDTALEAALGTIIEKTVDARDIDDVDPEATPPRTLSMVHADMDTRGLQEMREQSRTVSLEVNIAKVPEFAIGRAEGMQVGDRVSVELVPGRPPEWVPVSEIHLSWTTDGGFRVYPRIAEWTDTATARIVQRVNEIAIGWRRNRGSA